MKYKLVLTNGNAVIVESEMTLEEIADNVCSSEWVRDKKSGRLFFQDLLYG